MSFGTSRRSAFPAGLLALACVLLAAPRASRAEGATAPAAGSLVVVSTCDVKGKTVPCGCHTPKGGLARRAALCDSLRREYPHVLVVDSGGFFPESVADRDDAPFMSRAMRELGTDAAGVSEAELRFGRAYFLATVADAKLPVVCANLLDRATRRPVVAPSLLVKAGRARVGIFGLIGEQAPLGPSADSLVAGDPVAAARQAVADLRRQGATVIVLLSSLGKVGTEDLALAVEGIDLAVGGRGVPILQRARMVGKTAVVFGGEQGHYAGVSVLSLDAKGRATAVDSGTWMLGPEVADQPAMLARVGEFEARPETKLRRAPAARPAGADSTVTSSR